MGDVYLSSCPECGAAFMGWSEVKWHVICPVCTAATKREDWASVIV